MFIRIHGELRKRIEKCIETFNKKIENVRKYQTEITKLKKTIIELKYMLVRFNSRLG